MIRLNLTAAPAWLTLAPSLRLQVAQNSDQPLVVNLAVAALDPLTRAQFFQHVIHGGQGQPGVGLLPILAMRVELFAKGAQVIALGIGEVGEGEGVEALGFCIHWVIPHP